MRGLSPVQILESNPESSGGFAASSLTPTPGICVHLVTKFRHDELCEAGLVDLDFSGALATLISRSALFANDWAQKDRLFGCMSEAMKEATLDQQNRLRPRETEPSEGELGCRSCHLTMRYTLSIQATWLHGKNLRL